MIEEFTVTVPAPAGEEARVASVYVPKTSAPCPVVYLFDGQTAFFDERSPYGGSLRLGEFLDEHSVPVIVAAVACDMRNRLTEYSPFAFSIGGKFASEGKGKVYMDWLTGTFKPMIDGRFHTLSDRVHTYIMGSSMGGLMTMYALADYAQVFSRGVAMSPAVWVDAEKSAALVRRFPADAKIYLDYGTGEFSAVFPSQRPALGALKDALEDWGGGYEFQMIKGAKHTESAWRRRLPAAFSFLGFGVR